MTILFESKNKRQKIFLSPLVLYYAMVDASFDNQLTYYVRYITKDYVEKSFTQTVVSENEIRFFQHMLEKECEEVEELILYSKVNGRELNGFITKLGIHDILTERNHVRYFGELDSSLKVPIQKTKSLGFSPFLPVIKYWEISK